MYDPIKVMAAIVIGASVKQCVQIGANVVVGASAAVVKDVSDGLTVVGVPAKTHGMTTTPSLRTE